MPTIGYLKVNKVTIQGKNENNEMRDSSDYSLDVKHDVLEITRKDPSSSTPEVLLTISKEDADPIDPSMPIGENTNIIVHKNIMAKGMIMADGMIHTKDELHGMGARVHAHGNYEVVANADPVYETYKTYDASQMQMATEMGMSHMDHMIGHTMEDGKVMSMFNKGTMFMSQDFNLLGPLLALEFCIKMQPHHQEAVDTGDVMYKWAVDGGVGHLGFHLSYWQDVEINRQHLIGVALIDYINGNSSYPQAVKDAVNAYKVLYKRVRPGLGTHYYDKDSDSFKEGGIMDYKSSNEVDFTTGNFGARNFIKYWPEYKRMMGAQFYEYDLGPDDIWPHAEVKFLRDMHEQNSGGHMMIGSLLSVLNKIKHPNSDVDYTVNADNYTKERFANALNVLNDIDQIITTFLGKQLMESSKSKTSIYQTIAREYKIYFGEVPYLLKEIQRIGLTNRFTYDTAPFQTGTSSGGHGGHDGHNMGGGHGGHMGRKVCPVKGTIPCECPNGNC